MSFDGSRFTFDPWNNFSGVVMEQGRVQLDSDWNEWLAELARRNQAGTLDIVGQSGVPEITKDGFKISVAADEFGTTIDIGPGRMYVDGLLAENHGLPTPNPEKWTPETDAVPLSTYPDWNPHLAELVGSQPVDYNSQPYYPNSHVLNPFPQTGGPYLVYLDVWQREVTFLEDPDLVEKAVGVDTTGRIQTVWQVRWLDVHTLSGVICSTEASAIPPWAALHKPPPRLSTGVVTSTTSGPCCLTPNTGYTGLENQLYRVEIHQPGSPTGGASPTATFKWSRDNASVATSVTAIDPSGTLLTVQNTGKDNVLRFSPNNWVEITDDWLELNALPGELHQVASVNDAAGTITLTSPIKGSFPSATILFRHTRLTRWDQGTEASSTGDIPLPASGTTVTLENGITVSFSWTSGQRLFNTGDFWTFAARTADGTVEYLDQAPPRGINHHYARLALVTLPATVYDCRHHFRPLTDLRDCGCCCTSVTVGDGISSHGDFNDIQKAIASLTGTQPAEVCILQGMYTLTAPVNVTRGNLTIRGCSLANIQVASTSTGPAFTISSESQVSLDSLNVSMQAPFPVVQVALGTQIAIRKCAFTVATGVAELWVVIAQSSGLDVCDGVFTGGGIWVVDGSSQVSIKGNTLANSQGPGIGLGGLPASIPPAPSAAGVVTCAITANKITGAADSGIIAVDSLTGGDIQDLLIEDNYISGCAQNPPATSTVLAGILIFHAQNVRIHENEISNNGVNNAIPAYGVWATDIIDLEISDNLILDNGVIPSVTATRDQGGIWIFMVTDALRIHDNKVRTPAGPALTVVARGPVSVANNNLESLGVWPAGTFSALAVGILNVGYPLELPPTALSILDAVNTRVIVGPPAGFDLTLLDGRTLFEGNQVTFIPVAATGAFPCVLLSFDDLAIENNQFVTTIPGVKMFAHTFAIGLISLRCIGNRFSEIPLTFVLSLWGFGIFSLAAGNQATHCIVVQGVVPPGNQTMFLPLTCTALATALDKLI